MPLVMAEHADLHMRALMDTEGPFAGSEAENWRGVYLPYDPPPARRLNRGVLIGITYRL